MVSICTGKHINGPSAWGHTKLECLEQTTRHMLSIIRERLSIHFTVVGPSMMPSLDRGEHVLVDRLAYAENRLLNRLAKKTVGGAISHIFNGPQRGDITLVTTGEGSQKILIKRLIGLPGESIKVANGEVRINGVHIYESYTHTENLLMDRSESSSYLLRENEYFLLGDNRHASADSRDFGPVSRCMMLGRAWLVVHSRHGMKIIRRPLYNTY